VTKLPKDVQPPAIVRSALASDSSDRRAFRVKA